MEPSPEWCAMIDWTPQNTDRVHFSPSARAPDPDYERQALWLERIAPNCDAAADDGCGCGCWLCVLTDVLLTLDTRITDTKRLSRGIGCNPLEAKAPSPKWHSTLYTYPVRRRVASVHKGEHSIHNVWRDNTLYSFPKAASRAADEI